MKNSFLKLMLNILKNHMNFIMVCQFLAERMKIEKLKKLVYIIKLNAIPIRNLKQALNHGLVSKKVHRVIKFNENAWLKPYVDRMLI